MIGCVCVFSCWRFWWFVCVGSVVPFGSIMIVPCELALIIIMCLFGAAVLAVS